jgi:hypothetical protein
MQRSTVIVAQKAKKPKKRIPLSPPMIIGQFFQRVLFRYIQDTTAVANVYWRALANLLVLSTGTTAGYVPYTEIKPKSVTCWSPAVAATSGAGFAPIPLKLQFTAGELVSDEAQSMVVDRRYATDIPTNSRGASVRCKFDKPYKSYDVYAMVNATNSPLCFSVSGVVGTIVELDCVIKIFGDDRATSPKTSSTTGATAQTFYFNELDSCNATGAAGTQYLTPCNCLSNQVNGASWL